MEKKFYNAEDLSSTYKNNLFTLKHEKRIIKVLPFDEYRQIKETLNFLEEHKDLLPPMAYYDEEGTLSDGSIFISRPFYDSPTINTLLKSEDTTIKEKLNILKKLGLVLSQINVFYEELGICFGDVHGENFLFRENDCFPIDIESISTKIKRTNSSPFLYLAKDAWKIKKYGAINGGKILASKDTDFFSLIMLCLSVISNSIEIFHTNIPQYLSYLKYLDDLGFNKELIDCFASIYEESPTINPTELIDTIPLDLTKASYSTYIAQK